MLVAPGVSAGRLILIMKSYVALPMQNDGTRLGRDEALRVTVFDELAPGWSSE
jgi:hypothetical protein